MTLEESNEKLRSLREEREEYRKLSAQKADLEQQLDQCRSRRLDAERVLEQEQADVDRLEDKGLAYVFHTILGDRQEKLAKERREALAAHLSHQQAVQEEADVSARLDEVRTRWAALAGAEGRYRAALKEKQALLKELPGPAARRMEELEQTVTRAESQLREIDEARQAARSVLSCLDGAADSLDSAENWGLWDMFGGGMISTAIKHDHIDDAREQVAGAQLALSRLRTELADVEMVEGPVVSIGEFATFADYFFDGLIADWLVQDGIHDAQDSVFHTRSQVESILHRLDQAAGTQRSRAQWARTELEQLTLES